MFYVNNNSFCKLGNTAELKDFFCQFSSERYLRISFYTKVADSFLPTAILPKLNFFCRIFLIFDKKCRPITFRWLLLLIAFTQVVFREKVCFIETTSINYYFTETYQSKEIHFAASWWALIIKGRCNTLCSNDISLNVTLISTACHCIIRR